MMVLQRGAIKFWVGYRKKKKKKIHILLLFLSLCLYYGICLDQQSGDCVFTADHQHKRYAFLFIYLFLLTECEN